MASAYTFAMLKTLPRHFVLRLLGSNPSASSAGRSKKSGMLVAWQRVPITCRGLRKERRFDRPVVSKKLTCSQTGRVGCLYPLGTTQVILSLLTVSWPCCCCANAAITLCITLDLAYSARFFAGRGPEAKPRQH